MSLITVNDYKIKKDILDADGVVLSVVSQGRAIA